MKYFILCFIAAFTLGASLQASAAGKFTVPEPITKEIDSYRGNPKLAPRAEAFDQLVLLMENLYSPSLEDAIKASDLDAKTIQFITDHSRGLFPIGALLAQKPVESGYSLGLSAKEGQYEMLSERMNFTAWSEAYAGFGIDWKKEKNHTAIFLEKVTATNKPVVFLLPNTLVKYNQPSITKNEFTWLMNNPGKMKNVFFFLGGYELITEEMKNLADQAGLSNDMFRALFMRALGAESSNYDEAL
ncbi:hypothetical protein ACLVWU_05650 [Bdellovibrio sp. HCB290]|uniref:hypothetical protein n=1 Tax=Bdellovibrio sp. HCB290 TaxID=3394356 RepID=UPI0039B42088